MPKTTNHDTLIYLLRGGEATVEKPSQKRVDEKFWPAEGRCSARGRRSREPN